MKYFIDTEFIEGFQKPIFQKPRHFIDLISIGIVCEDGRTYSAISNEYSYLDADEWVKKNVIKPLYISTVHGDNRNKVGVSSFHKYFGKPNKVIANDIYNFCLDGEKIQPMGIGNPYEPIVEFYGYYADYDWVLFCSLFGRMIDLPKGFPMYCIDLKQMLDEVVRKGFFPQPHRPVDFKDAINMFKEQFGFPKQENEHNALDDAEWNKKLYEFILTTP